ncbi:MAG: hypothetical protein WKG06_34430 [Segetibacter sp.]
MKDYLTDTFKYNDTTNRKLLTKINQLAEKQESVRLFSHLINCQYKWMARIVQQPDAQEMSWWEPVYEINKLKEQWNKSLADLACLY